MVYFSKSKTYCKQFFCVGLSFKKLTDIWTTLSAECGFKQILMGNYLCRTEGTDISCPIITNISM